MDKTRANEIIGVDENASDTEKNEAYYKHMKNIASGFDIKDKVTGESITKEELEEAYLKVVEKEEIEVEISTKSKIGDFCHYHGIKVLIALIAVIVLVSAFFKPQYDLKILFIGTNYYDGDIKSLEDNIKIKMPELKNVKTSQIDASQIQITGGVYDIVVCDEANFDLYAQSSAFENLDPILKQIGINTIDESIKKFVKNPDSKSNGEQVLYGLDLTKNDLMKLRVGSVQNAINSASANDLIDNGSTTKIVSMYINPNNRENCLRFLKQVLGQ